MTYIPSSTSSINRRVINNIQHASNAMNKQYANISSGKSANRWSDLEAYDSAALQELEARIMSCSAEMNLYRAQERKIEGIARSMQNINDIVSKTIYDTLQAKNPVFGKQVPLRISSAQRLEALQIELSASYEGDYLFGGFKTNTPPVSDIVNHSNLTRAGQPNNSYYLGDQPPDVITAGASMFQKTIAALHLLKTGDNTQYDRALEWLQQSGEEIITEMTKLHSQSHNLKEQIRTTQDLQDHLGEEKYKIIGLDLPTAMIELENQVNTLNATFMATAHTQQLSLVNYLK